MISAEEPFNLDGLSPREREILELASLGRTDEQIAQGMGISTSTVNSYWVRIRGKVGQISRTELVAKTLRQEMIQTNRSLQEENVRLQATLRETVARLTELQATMSALRDNSTELLPALVHSPHATLVTGPPATVVYANPEACRLYGAADGELKGIHMRDLCAEGTPEEVCEPCRILFEDGGPDQEVTGIEQPYLARRRDGSSFRAVVRAARYETPAGPLAVATVEPFANSAELVIAALRSTLA